MSQLELEKPAIFPDLVAACHRPTRLMYRGEDQMEGLDVAAWLLSMLAQAYPGVSVFCKAFQEKPHGAGVAQELLGRTAAPAERILLDTLRLTVELADRTQDSCKPSLSGVFEIPDKGMYVIPMMDLELIAHGDDQASVESDLEVLSRKLGKRGISGLFLRSGDVGRGSYHFIGDFALPYDPHYWTTMGLFMKIMVDETDNSSESQQNIDHSLVLGTMLTRCHSISEAQQVAQHIREIYPSIPSGQCRAGLLYDPRWVANKLFEEVNSLLRITPAKNYTNPPKLVAEMI